MANTGAYYYIDDVQMPAAVSIAPAREDLDGSSSGRSSETGTMIRIVVKAEVRNLQIKHEMLNPADLQMILTALKPPRVKFRYNDGGVMTTKYGYANKKEYPIRDYTDDSPEGSHWDLSFTFVDNAE